MSDFQFDFSGLDADDALDGVNFDTSLESVLGDLAQEDEQEPDNIDEVADVFASQLDALDDALGDEMVKKVVSPQFLASAEEEEPTAREDRHFKNEAQREIEETQRRIKEKYLESLNASPSPAQDASVPSTRDLKAMLDGPSLFDRPKIGSTQSLKSQLDGPSLFAPKPINAALRADQELFSRKSNSAAAAAADDDSSTLEEEEELPPTVASLVAVSSNNDDEDESSTLEEDDSVPPAAEEAATQEAEEEEEGWVYQEWKEGDEEEEGVEYTYVEYEVEEEEEGYETCQEVGYEEEGVIESNKSAEVPVVVAVVGGNMPAPSLLPPPSALPVGQDLPPPPSPSVLPPPPTTTTVATTLVSEAAVKEDDECPDLMLDDGSPEITPVVVTSDVPPPAVAAAEIPPPAAIPPPVVTTPEIPPPADVPPHVVATPEIPPPAAIPPPVIATPEIPPPADVPPHLVAPPDIPPPTRAVTPLVPPPSLGVAELPCDLPPADLPPPAAVASVPASFSTGFPPPPPAAAVVASSLDLQVAALPSDFPAPEPAYISEDMLIVPGDMPPPAIQGLTTEATALFGADFFDMIEEVAELPAVVVTQVANEHAPAPPANKCNLCETPLDDGEHALRLCTECHKGSCRSCTKMYILKSLGETEQRPICQPCVRTITMRVQALSPRVQKTSIQIPPPSAAPEQRQLSARERVELADKMAPKWAGDSPSQGGTLRAKKKERRGSFRKKAEVKAQLKKEKPKKGMTMRMKKEKKAEEKARMKKEKKKKGLYASHSEVPQLPKKERSGIYSSHGDIPLVGKKKEKKEKSIYSSHGELKMGVRARSSSRSSSGPTPSATPAATDPSSSPPPTKSGSTGSIPSDMPPPADLPPPPSIPTPAVVAVEPVVAAAVAVPVTSPAVVVAAVPKRSPRSTHRVSGAPKPKPKPAVAKVKLNKTQPEVAPAPLKKVVKAETQVWDYGTQARAIVSYKAENDDELTFNAGQLIIVTKVDAATDGTHQPFLHGYIEGTIRIKKFPAHVVERVEIK